MAIASPCLQPSHINSFPHQPSIIGGTTPYPCYIHPPHLPSSSLKKTWQIFSAAINGVDDMEQKEAVVKYDWTEQWYPLYLTKEVPDDAPLGLTVFDRQVVLYRDGSGELRCHQDRCPHRYKFWSFWNILQEVS